MGFSILSLITWLPTLAAILLYLLPSARDQHGDKARVVAIASSLLIFILSLGLLTGFDASNPELQFVESIPWIQAFGIHYRLGLDGISILLVLLTTFLMPIVCLASHSVHSNRRGYLACMFVLQTAMTGTILALDVFLFYVFWEMMLAPMYFIIGIWGGKRRIYATLKFVLYTVFGSVLMLVAILYAVWAYYHQHGEVTFLIEQLVAGTNFTLQEEIWLFAAFALAFGIKVPIFPFHTWLPDAHVEAPTGGSVVLAGVMLKMGLYGFIRYAYPLFPRGAEEFAPYLALLAVIGIIYGALVAWVQVDMKKLVAYSSVSHLGFCVLGWVALNSVSTSGSILQMVNHGISTGALFLLVGVLYDRTHTRLIADYGGLAAKLPLFAFLFLVFTLSSIALPLTNGFVGEFLILTGSFRAFPILVTLSLLGVVLGAVYMLTLYMKTMYGELDQQKNGALTDLTKTELLTFAPLFIMVFWIGLYPQSFLGLMNPTLDRYLENLGNRRQELLENERRAEPGSTRFRTEALSASTTLNTKNNWSVSWGSAHFEQASVSSSLHGSPLSIGVPS